MSTLLPAFFFSLFCIGVGFVSTGGLSSCYRLVLITTGSRRPHIVQLRIKFSHTQFFSFLPVFCPFQFWFGCFFYPFQTFYSLCLFFMLILYAYSFLHQWFGHRSEQRLFEEQCNSQALQNVILLILISI